MAAPYRKLPTSGDPPMSDDGETPMTESLSLLTTEADAVRNRRRRCFATIFVVIVALGIAFAVLGVVVWQTTSSAASKSGSLQFDDVFNANFTPKSFSAAWMPTSDRLVRRRADSGGEDGRFELEVYNAESDPATAQLFCRFPAELAASSVAGYTVSPDER